MGNSKPSCTYETNCSLSKSRQGDVDFDQCHKNSNPPLDRFGSCSIKCNTFYWTVILQLTRRINAYDSHWDACEWPICLCVWSENDPCVLTLFACSIGCCGEVVGADRNWIKRYSNSTSLQSMPISTQASLLSGVIILFVAINRVHCSRPPRYLRLG